MDPNPTQPTPTPGEQESQSLSPQGGQGQVLGTSPNVDGGTLGSGSVGSRLSTQPAQGGLNSATIPPPVAKPGSLPFSRGWIGKLIWGAVGLVITGGLVFGGLSVYRGRNATKSGLGANVGVRSLDLSSVKLGSSGADEQQVNVNGLLNINKQVVLTPTDKPAKPATGQIYLDKTDQTLYFYDGKAFQALGGSAKPPTVDSLQGQTGAVVLTGGPGVDVNGSTISNSGVLSVQGQTGTIVLTGGAGVTISGTAITNSGVLSLQGQTGAVTLTSDAGGLTLTANGSNIHLSLPQGLSSGDQPTFAALTLAAPLGIGSGGTGVTSFDHNAVIITDGSGALQTASNSTSGLCLVSGVGPGGVPGFTNCSGTTAVTSLDGHFGDLVIDNSGATNVAGHLAISDASTSTKGIAIFNGTDFKDDGAGAIDTAQHINTSANVTFGSLSLGSFLTIANGGTGGNTIPTARAALHAAESGTNNDIIATGALNTIAPSGDLLIGATAQKFTIQGTDQSIITARGDSGAGNGGVTTIGFTGTSSFPVSYRFVRDPSHGSLSYDICTSDGNCNGQGGILGTGTTNFLPKFTNSQAVGDSIVSDDGAGTVTIAGAAVIQTTLGFQNGFNSNLVTFQAADSSPALTFTLPNSYGSSGFCLTSNGLGALAFAACLSGAGGGTGGVTSLDGQSGVINLANSTGASNVITIQDASKTVKGITQFNSTNFDDSTPGVINTVQGIALSSTPQFAGLTLTGDLHIGSGNTLFTNQITHVGGNDIALNAGGDNITFATNSTDSFTFPTGGGINQTICTTGSPCVVGGGTAVQLGPNAIQTDITTNPSIDINKTNATGDLIHIERSGTPTLVVNNAGNLAFSGDLTTTGSGTGQLTIHANGAVYSLPSGGGTQTICTTASPCPGVGAISVLLAPGAVAQPNNSATDSSIFIKNTGGAKLVELQKASGDVFTIDNNGNTVINSGTLTVSTLANGVATITGGVLGSSSVLPIALGGTNASTALLARGQLGAAASGANSDISSLTVVTSIDNSAANLSIGDIARVLTLQGNASSVFTVTSGSFTTQAGFTAPTANRSILFPDLSGTVCVKGSVNNCVGVGGAISGAGTVGTLALFSGTTSNIGDSLISQALGVIAIGGPATLASAAGYQLGFKNATNDKIVGLQSGVPLSSITFTLPTGIPGSNAQCLTGNTDGTLHFATCTTGGGGGGGSVTSINTLSGDVILADTVSPPSGQTIHIKDASTTVKGITKFNSTNFDDTTAGTINTIQGICQTCSVTFGGLDLSAGTPLAVNSGGTGAITAQLALTSLNAANRQLHNLTGVDISADLTTTTNNTLNLGGATNPFASGYFGTSVSTPKLQSASTLQFVTNGSTDPTLVLDSSANAYFGNGITNISPSSYTISATGSGLAGSVGGSLAIQGGAGFASSTGSAGGNLTLTGGAAGGSNNNNGGTLALDSGTATGSGTSTINIGANNATVISLGSTTTSLSLQGGTGINIGTANIANAINLGNASAPLNLKGTTASTAIYTNPIAPNYTLTVAPSTASGAQTGNLVFRYDLHTTPGIYEICTTAASSNCVNAFGVSFLGKNIQDSSSASVTNNLYAFNNTNTTSSAGVLALTNSGGGDTLKVATTGPSGNPASGNALLVINNNATTPSGNLLALQNKTAQVFGVSNTGATTITPSTDSANIFQIQDSLNDNIFSVDSASNIIAGSGNLVLTSLALTPSGFGLDSPAQSYTGGSFTQSSPTFSYDVTATRASTESLPTSSISTPAIAPVPGPSTGPTLTGTHVVGGSLTGTASPTYRYNVEIAYSVDVPVPNNGSVNPVFETGTRSTNIFLTTGQNAIIASWAPGSVPLGAKYVNLYISDPVVPCSHGLVPGSVNSITTSTVTIAQTSCFGANSPGPAPDYDNAFTSTNAWNLSWNSVAGATGYNIYRATSPTSTFQLLNSNVGNGATTYSDTNPSASTGAAAPTSTSNRLGIGTNLPLANLDVRGNAAFTNGSDTTTAFQVQNAEGGNVFNIDTQNGIVGTAATSTVSTNSASFTLKTGNATGGTSNSGSLTIDTGTATGTAGNIFIDTGNFSHDMTIGNTAAGSGITQKVGTGNYLLQGSGAATYTIGTGATTGVITIGATAELGTITLGQSTVANVISIGGGVTTSGTQEVDLANGATASGATAAVNIATNGAAGSTSTISIGDGTTNTTNITLEGNTTICSTGSGTSYACAVHIGDTTNNTAVQAVAIGSSAALAGNTLLLQGGNSTTSGSEAVRIQTAATGTIAIDSANNIAGTQTINIGGGTSTTSGGKAVNIATGVPGAGTTNAVAIGTGGTTTGLVGVTIGSNGNANHTLVLQGGNSATGGTEAVKIQTAILGAIAIGGTTQTGYITLGQSGTGQTINIGKAATSGSNIITIGNTNNASALNLNAGTGNINLSTNSASASVIVKSNTNSTTAFQIQNGLGTNNLFIADTTSNTNTGNGTITGTTAGRIGIGTVPTTTTIGGNANNATLEVKSTGGVFTTALQIDAKAGADSLQIVTSAGGYDNLDVDTNGLTTLRAAASNNGDSTHSATANTFNVLPATGGQPAFSVNDQGFIGIDGAARRTLNSQNAVVEVYGNNSDNVGVRISGTSSQTADLLQALNSSGTILTSIDHAGDLTVGSNTVNLNATLTVNGHIISGGGAASVVSGAAANCNSSVTPTISGNDTAGTVSFTTGPAPCAAGVLATVTFNNNNGLNLYGSAPRVILTPANLVSSGIQYFNGSVSTTSFTIDTATAAAPAIVYKYNYFVIQ